MKHIISASYRTDIPSFKSEWFYGEVENGYTVIHSKYGDRKVSLKPEDVYCFVFWTKNVSEHFKSNLDKLKSPYIFQWTITGYGKDMEENLPDKTDIINNFIEISKKVGPKRNIWRYDPILMSEKYTVEYHKKAFERLCQKLQGSTERCIISFMDEYGKILNLVRQGLMRAPTKEEVEELSEFIGKKTAEYGMHAQTCCENDYDLTKYGIPEGPCIDPLLIESEFGIELSEGTKKPNSFRQCTCARNTDIGEYHTCQHGCKYCYAK